MKSITLFAAFVLPFLFVSCTKDNSASSSSTKDIEGTWNLVSISGISDVSSTTQQGGSTIMATTSYNYASTSASGKYVITATEMNGQNVTYSASGPLTTKVYMDGTLMQDYSNITPFTAPVSSPVANYKKVGTDSIFVTGGTFVNVSSGSTTAVTPVGYRYKIEGTKLTMTMNLVQNSTTVQSGISVTQKINAKATVILQKQ